MKWHRWEVFIVSDLTSYNVAPRWLRFHREEDARAQAAALNERVASDTLRWEVRER